MSTWTGPNGTFFDPKSGDTSDAANWLGGLPSAGSDFVFGAGDYTVTHSTRDNFGDVTVGSGVTFNVKDGTSSGAVGFSSIYNVGSIGIVNSSVTFKTITNYKSGIISLENVDGQQGDQTKAANYGVLRSNNCFVKMYISNFGSIISDKASSSFKGFLLNGAVDNEIGGTILGTGAGKVYVTLTSNKGLIKASDGGFVEAREENAKLQGGQWLATGNGSTINVLTSDDTSFQTLAADTVVTLSGAGSMLTKTKLSTRATSTLESQLTAISAGATLQVLSNRDYTTSNSLTLNGTLQLGGGTLTADRVTTMSGSVLSGYGSVAGLLYAHGQINADVGQALKLTGTSTIDGTLGGKGTIDFAAGTAGLYAGTVLSAQNLAISGADVAVYTDLSYKGALTMSGGVLSLVYKTLTLTGNDTFTGGKVTANGTLNLRGTTTIAGDTFTVQNDVRATNTKTVTAVGDLTLGGAAKFVNAATGTYTLGGTGSADIFAATGATGGFFNQGLLQKTTTFDKSEITAALVNTGTITTSASAGLKLSGGVTGTGKIAIVGIGTLEIGGAVSAGQAISFAAEGNGTLLIDAGRSFAGTVAGFVAGDTIDLGGVGSAGAKVYYNAKADGSGGSLIVKNATDRAVINLAGQFLASAFHVAADGHGGTAVTYTPPTQQNTLSLAAAHA